MKNGAIKMEDAIKLWQAGGMVFFAEYRMSKGSHIKWRDKVSGKMLEADVLLHTVETSDSSIAVNERLNDGVMPSDRIAELGLVKQQRVLLHLEALTVTKGLVQARGTLQEVEGWQAVPVQKTAAPAATGGKGPA